MVQAQPEDGQVMPKMTSAADWWRSSGLVHEAGLAGLQFKLTFGQPADQYEQEADRVAEQVVSQINTPQPSQQVQRQQTEDETLMLKEASEQQPAKRLPASFKGTNLTTEALFEQMAFMSYEDQKTPGLETARAKLLKQHGYTTGHFIVGLKGFQMRLYEPIPEGQEGHSPGLSTVLAFRGTEGDKVTQPEGKQDVKTDFDPVGISHPIQRQQTTDRDQPTFCRPTRSGDCDRAFSRGSPSTDGSHRTEVSAFDCAGGDVCFARDQPRAHQSYRAVQSGAQEP
nr:hypothetical protein [Anthocerotibacter panamensis]